MQDLVFDEGYKEFSINGDLNRVIRFNPKDVGILERFDTAQKKIREYIKAMPDDESDQGKAVEELRKADAFIRQQVDYIFGGSVEAAAFGSQSPLSTNGGVTLCERFLQAVQPVLEHEIDEERKKSRERTAKYTSRYLK